MALRGVEKLVGELEKAKDGLKDVDKNIAKLTGKEPTESRFPQNQRRSWDGERTRARDAHGPERIFTAARRGMVHEDGPPAKRRSLGGAFSRLGPRVATSRIAPNRDMDSGDDDDLTYKPAVQSSVIATPQIIKSREEVADSQSKDKESKGRNRRMFGLLLGTLQKFKAEEKTKEDKVKLRKAVEDKLEQKAKKEKDDVRQERVQLLKEKRNKEEKIKRLEQKMELVKIHQEWESQTQMLGNFIRTKAKPHLYYMPKLQLPATEERLNLTKDLLQNIIQDRRQQLEEEIEELAKEDEKEKEKDDLMDVSHEESSKGNEILLKAEDKENFTITVSVTQDIPKEDNGDKEGSGIAVEGEDGEDVSRVGKVGSEEGGEPGESEAADHKGNEAEMSETKVEVTEKIQRRRSSHRRSRSQRESEGDVQPSVSGSHSSTNAEREGMGDAGNMQENDTKMDKEVNVPNAPSSEPMDQEES